MPRDGYRSETPPVERILHSDELISACFLCEGISPCRLQCAFVCLGTAVGKKYSVHPGDTVQFFCRFSTAFMIIEIGGMTQFVYLRLQSLVQFFVAIAQPAHGDPCREIKVLFSVRIIQIHAFSVIEHDRETVVYVDQIFLRCLYFIIHHDNTCFLHCLILRFRFLCS